MTLLKKPETRQWQGGICVVDSGRITFKNMLDRRTCAEQFGYLLDNDRFEELQRWIAEDCSYDIGSKILLGPLEIAEFYKANMEDGRKKFDELEWGKAVIEEIDDETFDVCFSDFLKHKGIEHRYKCKQRLTVNDDAKVLKIEHLEYPGEKEALIAFKKQVGL